VLQKGPARVKEPTSNINIDSALQRRVSVRTKREREMPTCIGDEEIELFLQTGDVYEMDAEMQHYYQHRVAKISADDPVSDKSRAVLVFRQGDECLLENDAGLVPLSLDRPDYIPPRYIDPLVSPLVLHEWYTVHELYNMNLHRYV
jgi:hypothetical protein